ncbi:hypothetical protein [Sphingomonas sp. IC4-52]|uniref:hypothetical protein n=1 Tax=Sphingomonas sp. IC4-52 TaxID=2887202 RepID=UPI001D10431C|nr:hypothetical protein [Sphingomonas sp. IC4-52]MCC2980283.1 hypothetical protein [Sphingomonas sp. IC4-52]
MQVKPGSRWKSVVCTSEVVVVRPPKGEVTIACGGAPMVPLGDAVPDGGALSVDWSGGTVVGKRYVDDESGIELLGSKAGAGSLAVDGRALRLKEAKPLPASD